jgi:sugar phosphate isomerase/epimerase
MQLAINTGSLSFDTRAAIAEVHSLGFSAIELNLQQAELAYAFQRRPRLSFYQDLARELSLRKLAVTDAHALFLNAAQMFSARARREVLSIEGQVTRMLGAGILVVHPTDILEDEEGLDAYGADPQTRVRVPLVEGIVPVIRELQSGGVTVALENVQHWHDARGTNDAEVMARLTEALDCHVAFDARRGSGHPGLERWIELLGDRMAVLYLHDSVGGVEHHPPAAPDWRQIIPQLKRTSAEVCVLEATANRNPGAIKVSREFISKLLQAE